MPAEWGVVDAAPHLPRVKMSRFDFFTTEESRTLVAAARDSEEVRAAYAAAAFRVGVLI